MLHFPRWKIALVFIVCALGIVLAAPNLFTKKELANAPDWLPRERLSLGLDLRGGSHLLLEVDVSSVFKERLLNTVQTIRTDLRRARIGYTKIGVVGQTAAVTIRNPDQKSETGRDGETNLEHARRLLRNIEPGLRLETDGARLSLSYTEQAMRDRISQVLGQSIEIVRRRVDELGTTEPTIQRQGANRILVQVPGFGDPERLKKLLGKTAKMTFHLVDENYLPGTPLPSVPPPGDVFAKTEPDAQGRTVTYVLKRRVMVSGDTLVDSQPTYDKGRPVVSFRFDSIGARKFGRVTQQNVGRIFAIVLDGKVISAPRIQEPILGGSGIITGSFTPQEANDLAVLLRAGALPAPMTILEERTVGPDLGADSIAAGETACVIGFIFVLVFMLIAYWTFGFFANIALMFNMVLLIGALSVLQATLTLPGIAGIVLTLGMAVDANVLIFERIREEVEAGRTPLSAIDTGYRRAITTIVDANLTTLIAAVILFEFGTGPVRGFAVTLSLGILTSMFTGIMVTRLMVVFWMRRRRFQALPI